MGSEYPTAIEMYITDPAWVFTDALQGLPGDQLSIVIHKTACGSFCSATDVANFFHNDTAGHKSSHFVVGRDGSVIQVVHLKDGAGANCCLEAGHDAYWQPFLSQFGNLNRCTYSIEHEDWTSDNSQPMTQAQIDASHALVLWLCQKFKIPASHIMTHASLDPLSKARCPGPTYDMNAVRLYVERGGVAPGVEQQAVTTWNATASLLQAGYGATAPTTTRIYTAWLAAYLNAMLDFGPPATLEFDNIDWENHALKQQNFLGGIRAEFRIDQGITRFYDVHNKLVFSH